LTFSLIGGRPLSPFGSLALTLALTLAALPSFLNALGATRRCSALSDLFSLSSFSFLCVQGERLQIEFLNRDIRGADEGLA